MTEKIKDNAFIATVGDFEPSKLLEYQKIYAITTLLEEKLGDDLFQEILFVFVHSGIKRTLNEQPALDFDTRGFKKKVLIWIGEEMGHRPSKKILEKYDYVFKEYLREEDPKAELYGLPLVTPRECVDKPLTPLCDRAYNVLYSGNLNTNRVEFMYCLSKRPLWGAIIGKMVTTRVGGRLLLPILNTKDHDLSDLFPNSYVKFTHAFNTGMPWEEYMKQTENAKIILSPCGFCGPECFRLYEAMSRGCIVVTEKLPPMPYYEDIPVVQIDSWKNIHSVIEGLLSNTEKLEELSRQAKEFYFSTLSTKGIVDFIYTRVVENNSITK